MESKKMATKINRDPVLEAVDKTLDVVEENVDTVARIPRLRLNGTTTKQQITILTFMAAAGAAVGGIATYVVMKKRAKQDLSVVTSSPKDQPAKKGIEIGIERGEPLISPENPRFNQ